MTADFALKQTWIYVAIAGDDKILCGVINAETGAIDLRSEVSVRGGPEMLAVDSARRFLILGCHARHAAGDAHHGKGSLGSHRIDRESGGLTPINSVSLAEAPAHLSLDRKGGFILTAHYGAGKAAVHRLGADGRIGAATRWTASGGGAHCIHTDPSNRYAFLPHIALSPRNRDTWAPLLSPQHILPAGANTILQFKFDEESGTLTPNTPFQLPGEAGAGPRHYCYHPTLDVVYFSNEQGCAVTAYKLDTSNGTLAPFQHLSTLAAPPEGYTNCSSLRITRSGRFLFVLNRCQDKSTITGFAIDAAAGNLKRICAVPTESQPRELEIAGEFLYVAGFGSGRVGSYRILGDGTLRHLESTPVGKIPMWVLAVEDVAGNS